MDSRTEKLKIYLKKRQYKTALKKICGWISRGIDKMLFRIFALFPVRENVILFRSDSDFSDNARVFYDYLLKHSFNQKNKLIWLLSKTNPRDYIVPKNVKFIRFSSWHPVPRKDYYCAVAKCYIFTHNSGMTKSRDGQTLIHTTHSASQLKAAKYPSFGPKEYARDYQIACGPDAVLKRKAMMNNDESRFLILGLPRLDLLYYENDCLSRLINGYQGEKIILSMETFKQSTLYIDSNNLNDVYAINVVQSEEELLELNTFLKEKGYILIIKIHPLQDLSFLKAIKLENILFLTNEDLDKKNIQLYELVENADILLTDYSSIFYDFLLLDRPIGFLLEDMDKYDRGFIVENPLDEMVGEKIYTLKDLEAFIEETEAGIDNFESERKLLRDRVFSYQDGENCKRLLEWMQENYIIS